MLLIDKSGDEPRVLFTDAPEIDDINRALKIAGYREIRGGWKLTDVIAFEEQGGKLERVRVWEAWLQELPTVAEVASVGTLGANVVVERSRRR